MKAKYLVLCLAAVMILPAMAVAETTVKSTAKEQAAVELTVYNSNFALVKDT